MPATPCRWLPSSASSQSGSRDGPAAGWSGTVGRAGGAVPARLGRILGWLGLHLALIGAIALAFYYVDYHVLS